MSYAVLHIMKAKGTVSAITRHIERTTQPDNAHPELAHLNRSDFIRYPDGVSDLGGAIQHRLDNAGLTRKIGDNQVLALYALLTSDGEALRKLSDEGRLDEWAQTSIEWCRHTFGKENVVGAHLHMDEQTPHLHVTIVPIVTTQRKKKASEKKAKKRYRTKSANAPRLSADDVMTRDNLTKFQDTYAEAMKRFGLERGVRGSEARHVDQHEYYRDCLRKKDKLETEVSELAADKTKLEADAKRAERQVKVSEFQKKSIEQYNLMMRQQNGELTDEHDRLTQANQSLTRANASLAGENRRLQLEATNIDAEMAQLAARKTMMEMSTDKDLASYKAEIERYFPDIPELLITARYCRHVGFTEEMTRRLVNFQEVGFKGSLFSSEYNQKYSTEHSIAKVERDVKDKRKFNLTIDGINIFQWFRDQARKFLEKIGIRPKPQTKSRGIL